MDGSSVFCPHLVIGLGFFFLSNHAEINFVFSIEVLGLVELYWGRWSWANEFAAAVGRKGGMAATAMPWTNQTAPWVFT
jgi:hypothetical protein